MNLPAEWYSLRSLNFNPRTPSVHKMQTHAKNLLQMLKDSERVFDHFRDTRRFRFKMEKKSKYNENLNTTNLILF